MTLTIPVIPENAPFSPAQRSWLNGFLAGLIGQGAAAPAASVSAPPATAPTAAPEESEADFTWHDPALPMDERLKLADGKPYPRRLMAAMAQLDCGACGYLCKTYSEAIATGQERDLTRCAPGGKDTSRKLKELVAAEKAAGGAVSVSISAKTTKTEKADRASKFGRHHPFPAPLLKCDALNKAGSMKDTRLVCFDLKGSDLSYNVGDALGVFPENDPDLVGWVIEALDASGAELVIEPDGKRVTLFEALTHHYSLAKPNDQMLELLINSATNPADASSLKEILAGDGAPEGDEVLDLLRQFPSARPEPYEFVAALNSLQPRLYSISSSLRAHPDEVHLTVGVVRYVNGRGRQCKGVCSTYFADRIKPGQKVRIFVQPAHAFAVPENGETPIIMVGPGTGIAPFRAFLQERKATGANGKNWLLFGDQKQANDFLYEQELRAWQQDGLLTRLDTAFSRDQSEKVYVQDRMLEQGHELWQWLNQGAHFYVCGDAKRMATDVDNALKKIVSTHGGMNAEAAKTFVSDLAKSRRYQRDVY